MALVSLEAISFEKQGSALSVLASSSTISDLRLNELVGHGDNLAAIRVGGNGRSGAEATINEIMVENLTGAALSMDADFNFVIGSRFESIEVLDGTASIRIGGTEVPQLSSLRTSPSTPFWGKRSISPVSVRRVAGPVCHRRPRKPLRSGGGAKSTRGLSG